MTFFDQLHSLMKRKTKRYDLWVCENTKIIQVYDVQMPNTKNIWFQFYEYNFQTWKKMQSECVYVLKGNSYYDYSKMKYFVLKNLLYDVSFEWIKIQRNEQGVLTDKTINLIMKLHPRIMRGLFDIYNFFPKQFSKNELKDIEKQCSILFGQSQSVSNPNQWIVTYCNLVSFWDKFGLNYFDLLKLPAQTVNNLKRIMNLDNDYRSKDLK